MLPSPVHPPLLIPTRKFVRPILGEISQPYTAVTPNFKMV